MTVQSYVWRTALAMSLLCGLAPAWAQASQQSPPPSTPASPSGAAGRSTAAPRADAAAGQRLFVQKGCYACHGREGQGSPTTGPRLGPNPTPLEVFTRYVRTPRAQMPPYTGKVVTDAELADMYAFLQARPQPGSIDALVPK